MTESPFVNEWIKLGMLRELRTSTLRILHSRFRDSVPPEIVKQIQHDHPYELLERWSDFAIDASSIDEFIALLKS